MIGDKTSFENLQQYDGSLVKFGNNYGARIVGNGLVKFKNEKIKTEEVLFVVDLKNNLLSVSQICDKGNDVIFKKHDCEIIREKSGNLIAHGTRAFGNLYTLVENIENSCLLSQEDVNWLQHKRLGHINFDNFTNIKSRKEVRDIHCISKP